MNLMRDAHPWETGTLHGFCKPMTLLRKSAISPPITVRSVSSHREKLRLCRLNLTLAALSSGHGLATAASNRASRRR
jgi:hypothetical protein